MNRKKKKKRAPAHHDHNHNHDHDHAHSHDHDHEHHDEEGAFEHPPVREPLPRGAGRNKLLFFDCFSGVAGDMTIAALLDLGVPFAAIEAAVGKLPLRGYELVVRGLSRSGIVASKLDVLVSGSQPHRTYRDIDAMLKASRLEAAIKELARRIFRRLGEAEADTHRLPLDEVHFHEVGAIDAIVDIVGSAAGLSYLGAEVVASPLPMGRGFVRADHGVLPLPAPATVMCLRGAPTISVDLEAELVTPTGAAIVATVARRYARWPAMVPVRVGYGAGTRRLPDRPNLLRLVLGDPLDEVPQDGTHAVVEANVDDMTGELAAHAIQALLHAGALDAWAEPITMKKGRPGLRMGALAPRALAALVAEVLLRETTTIGVRTYFVSRVERPREQLTIDTRFGVLPIKVSGGDPGHVKPEFDACARAAAEHGVPVRVVIEAALVAYHAREG